MELCLNSEVLFSYKNRDLRIFFISLTEIIFGGPYCDRNGLHVAALKNGDLKPLQSESLTVGFILWKQKNSVKQMLQWITVLAPLELQMYLPGVTAQNLNKACNDLMKKAQKLGKNKKKEELELLKQSLFVSFTWFERTNG